MFDGFQSKPHFPFLSFAREKICTNPTWLNQVSVPNPVFIPQYGKIPHLPSLPTPRTNRFPGATLWKCLPSPATAGLAAISLQSWQTHRARGWHCSPTASQHKRWSTFKVRCVGLRSCLSGLQNKFKIPDSYWWLGSHWTRCHVEL